MNLLPQVSMDLGRKLSLLSFCQKFYRTLLFSVAVLAALPLCRPVLAQSPFSGSSLTEEELRMLSSHYGLIYSMPVEVLRPDDGLTAQEFVDQNSSDQPGQKNLLFKSLPDRKSAVQVIGELNQKVGNSIQWLSFGRTGYKKQVYVPAYLLTQEGKKYCEGSGSNQSLCAKYFFLTWDSKNVDAYFRGMWAGGEIAWDQVAAETATGAVIGFLFPVGAALVGTPVMLVVGGAMLGYLALDAASTLIRDVANAAKKASVAEAYAYGQQRSGVYCTRTLGFVGGAGSGLGAGAASARAVTAATPVLREGFKALQNLATAYGKNLAKKLAPKLSPVVSAAKKGAAVVQKAAERAGSSTSASSKKAENPESPAPTTSNIFGPDGEIPSGAASQGSQSTTQDAVNLATSRVPDYLKNSSAKFGAGEFEVRSWDVFVKPAQPVSSDVAATVEVQVRGVSSQAGNPIQVKKTVEVLQNGNTRAPLQNPGWHVVNEDGTLGRLMVDGPDALLNVYVAAVKETAGKSGRPLGAVVSGSRELSVGTAAKQSELPSAKRKAVPYQREFSVLYFEVPTDVSLTSTIPLKVSRVEFIKSDLATSAFKAGGPIQGNFTVQFHTKMPDGGTYQFMQFEGIAGQAAKGDGKSTWFSKSEGTLTFYNSSGSNLRQARGNFMDLVNKSIEDHPKYFVESFFRHIDTNGPVLLRAGSSEAAPEGRYVIFEDSSKPNLRTIPSEAEPTALASATDLLGQPNWSQFQLKVPAKKWQSGSKIQFNKSEYLPLEKVDVVMEPWERDPSVVQMTLKFYTQQDGQFLPVAELFSTVSPNWGPEFPLQGELRFFNQNGDLVQGSIQNGQVRSLIDKLFTAPRAQLEGFVPSLFSLIKQVVVSDGPINSPKSLNLWNRTAAVDAPVAVQATSARSSKAKPKFPLSEVRVGPDVVALESVSIHFSARNAEGFYPFVAEFEGARVSTTATGGKSGADAVIVEGSLKINPETQQLIIHQWQARAEVGDRQPSQTFDQGPLKNAFRQFLRENPQEVKAAAETQGEISRGAQSVRYSSGVEENLGSLRASVAKVIQDALKVETTSPVEVVVGESVPRSYYLDRVQVEVKPGAMPDFGSKVDGQLKMVISGRESNGAPFVAEATAPIDLNTGAPSRSVSWRLWEGVDSVPAPGQEVPALPNTWKGFNEYPCRAWWDVFQKTVSELTSWNELLKSASKESSSPATTPSQVVTVKYRQHPDVVQEFSRANVRATAMKKKTIEERTQAFLAWAEQGSNKKEVERQVIARLGQIRDASRALNFRVVINTGDKTVSIQASNYRGNHGQATKTEAEWRRWLNVLGLDVQSSKPIQGAKYGEPTDQVTSPLSAKFLELFGY